MIKQISPQVKKKKTPAKKSSRKKVTTEKIVPKIPKSEKKIQTEFIEKSPDDEDEEAVNLVGFTFDSKSPKPEPKQNHGPQKLETFIQREVTEEDPESDKVNAVVVGHTFDSKSPKPGPRRVELPAPIVPSTDPPAVPSIPKYPTSKWTSLMPKETATTNMEAMPKDIQEKFVRALSKKSSNPAPDVFYHHYDARSSSQVSGSTFSTAAAPTSPRTHNFGGNPPGNFCGWQTLASGVGGRICSARGGSDGKDSVWKNFGRIQQNQGMPSNVPDACGRFRYIIGPTGPTGPTGSSGFLDLQDRLDHKDRKVTKVREVILGPWEF